METYERDGFGFQDGSLSIMIVIINAGRGYL